jgi:hypothetical protein
LLGNPAHNISSKLSRVRIWPEMGEGMRLQWMLAGLLFALATSVVGVQVRSRYTGGGMAPPTGVKNAPFSAVVITIYDRALDNGGHIHRETHGKIYRDSQGRMRTETEMPAAQPGAEKYQHITINDPVRQVVIHLDSRNKSATVYPFGQGIGPTAPIPASSATAAPPRTKSEKSSRGPSPGSPATSSPIHVGTGVAPPVPAATGALNGKLQADERPVKTKNMNATVGTSSSETQTVSLGTRNMEGVLAVGTRTTRTLDADLMGSDKPVVSVSETWVSPELKMTVLAETDDGQSGHSTMKLVNIVRTEPDSQLFQIPADYSVRQTTPAAITTKP